MPVELAVGYVSLTTDASGIPKEIDRQLGRAGQSADRHGRSIGDKLSSGIGKTLKLGVGTAATAAGGVMASALTKGFGRLTAIDDAQGKLKALGNDAQTVQTIMNSALAAVKGTAYGLGDAATIAASAVAAGVKPGEELTRYLKMTADAASVAGVNLSDMGLIINQVRTGQQAYTDDLNQLADRGLPIYQWLGETMGVAAADVKKLASDGKISSEKFETAIQTHIGGAALSMGDTFKGSVANVNAALGRLGAGFLEPFFHRLQGGANDSTGALDGLTPKVTELGKSLDAKVFDEWGPKLKAALDSPEAKTTIEAITSTVGNLGKIAQDAAPAVAHVVGALASVGVGALSAGLRAAAGALEAITPPLKAVSGFIAGLPTPILAAAAALATFRLTGIGGKLATATNTTTTALRGFSDQMKLQQGLAAQSGRSIGRFGAAVATLEARVPVLGRMSESFRTTAESATVFARTQGTVAAASTGLKSAASGVVGMLGGPWALALTGGVAALTANVQSAQSAKQAQQALADATAVGARAQADFAKAVGAANGGLSDQAVAAGSAAVQASLASVTELGKRGHTIWEQLGHQIDNVTGNVFGSNDAWEKNYDKVTSNEEQYQALQKVMGDLKIDMAGVGETVTRGGPAYDNLISKLQATSDAGKTVAQTLIEQRTSLDQSAKAAQTATPGFFDLSAAVKILADESASAADRVDAMKTALDVMSGKPIAVQDALARYNQQVRDTAAATAEAWDASSGFGQALVGQGGQVDTATENGKRLYDELTSIRDATITAAEAGAKMDPILAQNQTQFAQLATSAGLTSEQVATMAAQLGYLPKDIEILASLKGADSVEQQLTVVEGLLRNNAQGVDIPVTALTDDARKELEATGVKIDEVNGKPGVVHVSAPDLATVLSKLQELIDKKLPDKTQRVNVTYEEATASGQWRAPMVFPKDMPRADGGIDGPLPSQATIQSPKTRLYQWAEPETGGEAFIPLAASKRSRSVGILGQVANMFGLGLTKMADGGVVPRGVADALAGARKVTGIKYAWGGTTPEGFDCSGLVGWLQQLLQGVANPTQRLYTTMSLLGGALAGLKPGFGPAGTYFQVGVNQEHMAATLNGQPVESGGSHGDSRIGSPAVGATDRQFTAHFYLPNELIAGIDEAGVSAGGKSRKSKKKAKEWTERDQIDLEQLQIDVEDAKADRAKMDEADSKSTDLDKRKADLRIRETEQKLVEKQQEKDKASSGDDGYVPAAPALERRMSDGEIDTEQAQIAIDDAESNRDEVYADPESTDTDKRKADLAVQSARNAQDDLLEKQAKTTPAGSVAESLKQFGASIFGAAVDAVRAQLPFGIGQSRYWDIEPPDMDKASKVPAGSFTQDEIDKQLPVTPGVADLSPYLTQAPTGIQQWLKLLPAITLHDDGGWLKPGEMALNMSSRPEPIFNSPAQMAQFMGGAELAPAAAAGSDYSVNIHSPNFSDGMAAIKAAQAYQERQIMRHAGRP